MINLNERDGRMKKRTYNDPVLEVICIELGDVVCASGPDVDNSNDTDVEIDFSF